MGATPVALALIQAEPAPLSVDLLRTALVIIDMQRDFLEPGGFGAALGNDVSRLQSAVEPCRAVLTAARNVGMLVIHTREGHRPDLSDAPLHKVERGDPVAEQRVVVLQARVRPVQPPPSVLQVQPAPVGKPGRQPVR